MPRRDSRRTCSSFAVMFAALTSVVACAEVVQVEDPVHYAGEAAAARARASVCHRDDGGTYRLLTVNAHAIDGHRAHGDASPGESVPGKPSYRFGAACEEKPLATNLTGVYEGTYSWNCGGSATGSSSIRFDLQDLGNGRLTGTATYLGGTIAIDPWDSYRWSNPQYRADGTLFSATLDPNGFGLRISVPAFPGHFVHNQFDGTIAPDFSRLSGGTLNGDSQMPWGQGCSAATGYSGSFSVDLSGG